MLNIMFAAAAAAAAAALLAYLLGSVSFAIVVSKLGYHKDVRDFGSGNAGMTNVLRTFGKKAAALTLLGDIGKGAVSVVLGRILFLLIAPETSAVYGAYIAAIFAVIGHLLPIFFKFKGGKGVSVATGALLCIEPALIIFLLAIFLIMMLIFKMVSLASITCAIFYPILTIGLNMLRDIPWGMPAIFATVIALIVIFMHRSNIGRIVHGTEYKFGQKKAIDSEKLENK